MLFGGGDNRTPQGRERARRLENSLNDSALKARLQSRGDRNRDRNIIEPSNTHRFWEGKTAPARHIPLVVMSDAANVGPSGR